MVDKNNRYLGFVSKSSILEAYRQQLIRNHRGVTFPSSLRGVGCCDRSPAVAGCFPVRTPRLVLSACPVLGRRALLRRFGFAARSFVVIVSPFLIPVCRRSFSVCPDKVRSASQSLFLS